MARKATERRRSRSSSRRIKETKELRRQNSGRARVIAKLSPQVFKDLRLEATRDGFGRGLIKAGLRDQNVVVVCGDLTESTKSAGFKEKFPDRFIEAGIAEQNMMSLAAGMALSGKVPFVTTYGVFCPGRNWDQLRISVCYSKANVKLTGAHTGISVGPDGATHQALEDIAIARALPNLTVIAPVDSIETEKATLAAARLKGPVYIRFGREKVPVVTTRNTDFKVGKAQIFRDGSDATIVACGALVYEALVAAKELAGKISVRVINSHTIKPLDARTMIKAARETGAIVTAEEHQITGGLGSAVAESLSQSHPVPLKIVGVQDRFGESGMPDELMKKFGLTAPNLVKAVREVISRK